MKKKFSVFFIVTFVWLSAFANDIPKKSLGQSCSWINVTLSCGANYNWCVPSSCDVGCVITTIIYDDYIYCQAPPPSEP